jgi:hypothetical protein
LKLPCATCGYVVDVLRSCYRSFWNLPGIGVVEGHYRFAPPGSPYYPDWHFLGSRNWHQGDRTPWPEFGELESAKQIWENGSVVEQPPIELVGEQACFGSTLTGVIGQPWQGAIDGVDARCWQNGRPNPVAGDTAAYKVSLLADSHVWFFAGGELPAAAGLEADSAGDTGAGPELSPAIELLGEGSQELTPRTMPAAAGLDVLSGFGHAVFDTLPLKLSWSPTNSGLGAGTEGGPAKVKIALVATSAKTP